MLLFSNKNEGEFHFLAVFIKKRNTSMPDEFDKFLSEFLILNPALNAKLPQSVLEKYERAIIANFYYSEYTRLKSKSQKRYNDWNTIFFEVKECMKPYIKENEKRQITIDREIRNLVRSEKKRKNLRF